MPQRLSLLPDSIIPGSMASNCCLYRDDNTGEKVYICTTGDCPELVDHAFLGTWPVDDCEDCFAAAGKEEVVPWRQALADANFRRELEDMFRNYELIRRLCEKFPEICERTPLVRRGEELKRETTKTMRKGS